MNRYEQENNRPPREEPSAPPQNFIEKNIKKAQQAQTDKETL